jgi:hypothetical protein
VTPSEAECRFEQELGGQASASPEGGMSLLIPNSGEPERGLAGCDSYLPVRPVIAPVIV